MYRYIHCMYTIMLMRDAEGRKEEASKVKQTTKQSNTHPRQSKYELPRVPGGTRTHDTLHMYVYTIQAWKALTVGTNEREALTLYGFS